MESKTDLINGLLVKAEPAGSPVAVSLARRNCMRFNLKFSQLLIPLCYGYLAFLLFVYAAFRYGANAWWLGTVIEFGPQWLCLLPAIPLSWAALFGHYSFRSKLHSGGLLLASCLICLVLLMGLTVNLSVPPAAEGLPLRLVTFNTDSRADLSRLVAHLLDSEIDVVCLHECRSRVDLNSFVPPGWHGVQQGEFIVTSRYRLSDIDVLRSNAEYRPLAAMRCRIHTSAGQISLVNVHMPTLRRGLRAVLRCEPGCIETLNGDMRQRGEDLVLLAPWVHGSKELPTIVAGDFNQTVGSLSYEQAWDTLANSFSTAGNRFGSTFFSHWQSSRIDHILATHDFTPVGCWPWGDFGSEHRPLFAELHLKK